MTKEDFAGRVMAAETTLYRVARSLLRREEDQKDAVSEAVMRAWAHRSSLREEKYFTTWLVRILINECRRLLKKQARTVLMADAQWHALEADSVPEDVLAVSSAVDNLPEKLRLPVVLYYMEGFALRETAAILAVPVGTVKARLHRARKALKMELEACEEAWQA